jgi:hypothetical protein
MLVGLTQGQRTTKIAIANAANTPQIAVAAAINPITAKAIQSLAKRTTAAQWGRATMWVLPSMAAWLDHLTCVTTVQAVSNRCCTRDSRQIALLVLPWFGGATKNVQEIGMNAATVDSGHSVTLYNSLDAGSLNLAIPS